MFKGVFVIAGHGKSATGAVDNGASGNGTNERTEVLQIARELSARLSSDRELSGLEVILIDEALSLADKIAQVQTVMKAKQWKATDALLIDIHLNSASSTDARGIEAWYGKSDDPGFAHMCVEELIAATGFPKRSVKSSDANRHGRLGILDDTTPTACLIECGFLTNEFDVKSIKDSAIDDAFAIGLHRAVRRMSGLSAESLDPSLPFTDVPAGEWYTESVRRNVARGVFLPNSDHLFRPSDTVTRAELSVMLDRLHSFIDTK